ncbi:hypothetical protein PB2503_09109 [Parvularcula bermudensis HTCC2503]|uniref:DUF2141 domain-containing protein n=1 Tax=Parvularcula bermudensis (strain ATCC BAA-594 / HTCC2503 / KCTC 12087) TaxID=314260 RepID=E0TCT6_PARBH|nr:DUF2141 domain-containing protein [Parvularcula bermudensis]ADM09875.1 hypothetical protein PB2503_09109 [Parvularcula bermudensis HTCC2503]
MKFVAPIAFAATLALVACGGGEETDAEEAMENAAESTQEAAEETMESVEMASEDAMAEVDETMDEMAAEADETMDEMTDDMAMVAVTVEGVEVDGGEVLAVLQTAEEFATLAGSYAATTDASAESVTLSFEDVEPGTYAVAVFQDTDGDGSLGFGDNGVPTEPWALSGAAQGGAPAFGPAEVDVMGETEVTVTLMK